MDVMRYAIEHGCKLFDFTIGDEPYKREWCDIEIELCDYVAPASLRGWLAAVPTVALRAASSAASSAIRRPGPSSARCGSLTGSLRG